MKPAGDGDSLIWGLVALMILGTIGYLGHDYFFGDMATTRAKARAEEKARLEWAYRTCGATEEAYRLRMIELSRIDETAKKYGGTFETQPLPEECWDFWRTHRAPPTKTKDPLGVPRPTDGYHVRRPGSEVGSISKCETSVPMPQRLRFASVGSGRTMRRHIDGREIKSCR